MDDKSEVKVDVVVDGDESRSQLRSDRPSTDTKGVNETKELQDQLKRVDVSMKPPASPTSFLARNTALLPSGVVRVRQLHNVTSDPKMKPPPASGGSSSATGNPRNKTALAPGHSLMDWIRLGSTGVDLTGVGGVPQNVTLTELAKHNKQNDAWLAIRGVVYNVTRYMDFHPGGVSELMKGVGKDATKLFDDVHAWVNYQSILQKCVVGRLSRLPAGSIISPEKTQVASSPGTISILSSCTKRTAGDVIPPTNVIPNPKMDWIQTSNTVTFFYYSLREHTAVTYELMQLNNSKLRLRICFEKDIIINELELTGDVEWPPRWKRNFETMKIEFTFTKRQSGVWKTYGTCTTLHEPKTKQRYYRDYKVVSNTPLCKVVNIIVLRADKYLTLIPIGRHIAAKMNVMGTEVSRMYTPVPSCLHPGDVAPMYQPDCICLMVKRYEDGALTPSMTALQPGQMLTLSNSLGTSVVEAFSDFTIVNMLVAGTGLTAMLSIIQWALGRRSTSAINLINFNRNEDTIFYDKHLKKVSSEEKRFKITHVLSEPGETWEGRRGRVTFELLTELLGDCTPQACVFTCGPKPFMQSVNQILQKHGWRTSQVHEFDD